MPAANGNLTRLAGVAVVALAAVTGTGIAGSAAAKPAGPASGTGRFPATFLAVASASPTRLAVYSARDGRRLRFLTIPQPGGGLGGLALSANGRTVAFQRALGTCAAAIDTVPAAGGTERTLIPMTGTGSRTALPYSPSYSGDGRYLLYETSRCRAPFKPLVHLRDLRTGREVRRRIARLAIAARAVFVNQDQQVAYVTLAGQHREADHHRPVPDRHRTEPVRP